MHRSLCQTRERDHTPATPATDAGANRSIEKSKTLYLPGFLSSAPCDVSGLNPEEADEAADLGGSPEGFLFFKNFKAAQFQFLLCVDWQTA